MGPDPASSLLAESYQGRRLRGGAGGQLSSSLEFGQNAGYQAKIFKFSLEGMPPDSPSLTGRFTMILLPRGFCSAYGPD